jgi:hypothetical protein
VFDGPDVASSPNRGVDDRRKSEETVMEPQIEPQMPMQRRAIVLLLLSAFLGFVIGRWTGVGGLVGAALAALAFYAIWIDLRVLALEAAFADQAKTLRDVRVSQGPGESHATQDAEPQ